MEFDELDEVNELVAESRVDELARIARSGSDRVSRHAIEGLVEVGGAEATSALVEMLAESVARPPRWGSEQELERERRQSQLVRSVARARGVTPPAGRSQEEIEEFLESCRER